MRIVDVAPAVVMLGLSTTVFLGTRELPYWTDFTPGPAFVPTWVAGAGVLLSVILLVQAWRAGGAAKPEWPGRAGAIRVILTTVGLIVCVPLAPYLGFIATMVVFMVAMMVGILRRKIVPSFITALFTGGLLYIVFVLWLKVALPAGPLGI
jgi:putative tricarboxylic transport membrane protein